MSNTENLLTPSSKGVSLIVSRQLLIMERLFRERDLALYVDEFNVPSDGTFEEAVKKTRPGGIIRIGAGKHHLEYGITITKPLSIKGEGYAACLVCSSVSGAIISIKTAGVFSIEGLTIEITREYAEDILKISADRAIIKYCNIIGNNFSINRYSSSGIDFYECQSGLIENTTVTSCHTGIQVYNSANIQIIDCHSNNNKSTGISLRRSVNCELKANLCDENMYGGMIFSESTGSANDNICRLNKGDGIGIYSHSSADLAGNTCENNEWGGIGFRKSSTGSAYDNTCRFNKWEGIRIYDHSSADLTGNTCENNEWGGITFDKSSRGLAEGNTCRLNKQNGIRVEDQSNADVTGNICEENGGCGIYFDESSTGTAERNICKFNKLYDIRCASQSNVKLTDNVYKDDKLSVTTSKNPESNHS